MISSKKGIYYNSIIKENITYQLIDSLLDFANKWLIFHFLKMKCQATKCTVEDVASIVSMDTCMEKIYIINGTHSPPVHWQKDFQPLEGTLAFFEPDIPTSKFVYPVWNNSTPKLDQTRSIIFILYWPRQAVTPVILLFPLQRASFVVAQFNSRQKTKYRQIFSLFIFFNRLR